MSHACHGDDEGVGTSAFGLFTDEPPASLHDFSDRCHLRIVERKEEALPAVQCLGEGVFAALQLVKNFIGRHEIAGRDGGVEPLPQGNEDVRRVISTDTNPDTRVDDVGRGHALPSGSCALYGPRDIFQML